MSRSVPSYELVSVSGAVVQSGTDLERMRRVRDERYARGVRLAIRRVVTISVIVDDLPSPVAEAIAVA